MPNFLEIRGLSQQQIVHDAQLIKAVPINDTDKADEKVLAYDQPADKLAYVPKCPEIVIKAIQHVIGTLLSTEISKSVLINEVDIDNTFLIHTGTRCSAGDARHQFAHIQLTDSTHITVTRYNSGHELPLHICAIEVTAGIKFIQRGTIEIHNEMYHDATITEVDTDKTFITNLGFKSTVNLTSQTLTTLVLLDSTTIRAQRAKLSGIITVSYEVVEFI